MLPRLRPLLVRARVAVCSVLPGQKVKESSIAYKLVPQALWESELAKHTYFKGTERDLNDGYIHLSTKAQLRGSARKFYPGQDGILCLCINLERVKGKVVWEPSKRTGELFPHVYGTLDTQCVMWKHKLELTSDKQDFLIPDGAPK